MMTDAQREYKELKLNRLKAQRREIEYEIKAIEDELLVESVEQQIEELMNGAQMRWVRRK